MISSQLISRINEFAKINGPLPGHIEIANNAGQKIAKTLRADKDVVLLGTLLMDCALGIAIKEQRISDHVQMSHDAAKNVLDQDNNITENEKQNVLFCILEHHGVNKFSSIESEIVCNADCYRFASIAGFYFALTQFDKNLAPDMAQLYKSKFIEKSKAISLEFVKEDLKDQINIINNFIQYI